MGDITDFIVSGWEDNEANKEVSVDLGENEFQVLAHILSCAPQKIRREWKRRGSIRALSVLTGPEKDKFECSLTNIEVTDEGPEFKFVHREDFSEEDLLRLIASLWETRRRGVCDPSRLDITFEALAHKPEWCVDEPVTERVLIDKYRRLNEVLDKMNMLGPHDIFHREIRTQAAIQTLLVIKEDMSRSVLTERVFISYLLADILTATEISQILGETYGSEISADAVYMYNLCAHRKTQGSEL